MVNFLRSFSLILVLLLSLPVHAEDTPLEFKNPAMQDRYMSLIKEIRCLVCQNESLADSHADLAGDLRKDIFEMMGSGKSNKEIIDFLVQRYGDFVLYNPPLKGNTVLLWFLPFVFLIIAIFTVVYFVRQRTAVAGPDLSGDEKDELDRFLGDKKNEV